MTLGGPDPSIPEDTTIRAVSRLEKTRLLACPDDGDRVFAGDIIWGRKGASTAFEMICPECGKFQPLPHQAALLDEGDGLTFPKPIVCVFGCGANFEVVKGRILWLEEKGEPRS